MGVIGSAKLLQAIARDNLIPGLSFFKGGSTKTDEPVYAIILTFVVAQVTMLFDINRIASFITMTYLMTFLATNLACFLLKISSAPNFRPSFHYFNLYTAAAGAVLSGISMFFVDGVYATGCVAVLVVLFLLIHYTSPPKSWGDVSQSLIYHQVRKYLLRLRQEHVKFWRPQILLFVNDIDTQYRMIQFCNSLKKGALFVLGHVIVTEDFSLAVPEARRQQAAWTKFIELSKVKAFTNIAVAPTAEWGIRNIVLNSGLGGMRPNIVVIDQYRRDQPLVETIQRISSKDRGLSLGHHGVSEDPSEIANPKGSISAKSYLTVLEDLLFKLRINVALARGFEHLELPSPGSHNTKRFIDLWPIQMSAELAADRESLLTTNFDTYTLILQLGCILHTVPSWRKTYQLRVAVFVEYETDIVEERGRVEALLEKLRIEAQVIVFSLVASGLKSYQIIVNGDTSPTVANAWDNVNSILHEDAWWHTIQNFRRSCRESDCRGRSSKTKSFGTVPSWPTPSLQEGGQRVVSQSLHGLKKLMESSKRRRRRSVVGLNVNLGMKTHRLLDSWVRYHSDTSEDSSSSEENGYEPYLSDSDNENTPDESAAVGLAGVPATQAEEPQTSSRQSKHRQEPPSLRPLRHCPSANLPHVSTEPGEPAASVDALESDVRADLSPGPAITITDDGGTATDAATLQRPSAYQSVSSNRFSSFPIPEASINPVEETGPSIMFSDSSSMSPDRPPQEAHRRESIYTRTSPSSTPTGSKRPASGFPERASIPLSFNDLPCRAQHLILNELIAQQSQETAVIFTTLPSPIEGTCLDDSASEAYVSDMDVLCQGLPPCLLVHSNSMTVTMNL